MLEDLSSSKSVVARLGGDEFGVLLPESTYKEAEEFLHKLRAGITSYNLNSQKKYNIDFSAGIIEYDEEIHTECSAIMQDADERMYEIKKGKTIVYEKIGHTALFFWPLKKSIS